MYIHRSDWIDKTNSFISCFDFVCVIESLTCQYLYCNHRITHLIVILNKYCRNQILNGFSIKFGWVGILSQSSVRLIVMSVMEFVKSTLLWSWTRLYIGIVYQFKKRKWNVEQLIIHWLCLLNFFKSQHTSTPCKISHITWINHVKYIYSKRMIQMRSNVCRCDVHNKTDSDTYRS